MSNNMPQNATLCNGLTVAQEKAVAALLAGQSITAAAKAAGVDRTTVHRWLRHPDSHQAFRRALHQGRQELHRQMEARLLALAPKAADCLENALEQGDAKVALMVLKGTGFLAGKQ